MEQETFYSQKYNKNVLKNSIRDVLLKCCCIVSKSTHSALKMGETLMYSIAFCNSYLTGLIFTKAVEIQESNEP